MTSKYRKSLEPMYYLLDAATHKYLSAKFEWNDHGARIPSMQEVQKAVRRLAELAEEGTRPAGWDKLPHIYLDLPASQFIPTSFLVVDMQKDPVVQARTIATQMVIQVWKERSTN